MAANMGYVPSGAGLAPTTPALSPMGTHPTSPKPKRPVNRDTIQIAAHGMRPMNNDDLSAVFYQLNQKIEQEMKYTHQLGEAVDSNAIILGQIVARVGGLEKISAATTSKADLIDNYLTQNTTKV